MLLYSLLYLTGYKSIKIRDIKNFRQLDSICAGHPEYHPNTGIETTTGPLGQGIANAVAWETVDIGTAQTYSDVSTGSSQTWTDVSTGTAQTWEKVDEVEKVA